MCESFKRVAIFFAILTALLLSGSLAGAGLIDFENLADGEIVTTQYSGQGVNFAGQTIALQAGGLLNEFEFPPRSGVTVVVSDVGELGIAFNAPQASVGGFFTHFSPITLTAFDALDNPVGSSTSAAGDNTVSSGNPPNEFLGTSSLTGILRVAIVGLPNEFTLDDLTFTSLPPVIDVPEPGIGLLEIGMLALSAVAVSRLQRTHPRT